MLKPTTPISAGAAQSFDSSGMIQALEYEKNKRQKRFEDNVKSFDSGQVWHRDIPEFTNKVNKYYEYISDNYDALSNKSRNLDKWYEMKSMENDIANFTVGSKAMGQSVDRAQKLMLDKPHLYDTPENQQLIDDQITGNAYGGLTEGYKSGQAHNSSFMQNFDRNIFVDTDELQNRMSEFGTPNPENVEVNEISGRRKSSRYGIDYNLENMAKSLEDMWNNGYTSVRGEVSGTDLQRKYKGDFEAFATAATAGLPEYTDPKEFTEPGEDDGGAPDYKWFTEKAPSGTVVIGQHTSSETIPGGLLRKDRTVETNDPYIFKPSSRGNVNTGGTKSVFRRKAGASGGYNMRDNVWSTTNLTDDNISQLTNVDYGFMAEAPLYFESISMRNEQGELVKLKNYTVPKGGVLSDEMIAAINAGQAKYVSDTGTREPLMRDVNATKYIWEGPIAYSRNTSYASGFDIDNPMSYMNSLTGKQYRSMAEKWEDYSNDVGMHPAQKADIQANLDSYNVSPYFSDPLIEPTQTSEFDYETLMKEAQLGITK